MLVWAQREMVVTAKGKVDAGAGRGLEGQDQHRALCMPPNLNCWRRTYMNAGMCMDIQVSGWRGCQLKM